MFEKFLRFPIGYLFHLFRSGKNSSHFFLDFWLITRGFLQKNRFVYLVFLLEEDQIIALIRQIISSVNFLQIFLHLRHLFLLIISPLDFEQFPLGNCYQSRVCSSF